MESSKSESKKSDVKTSAKKKSDKKKSEKPVKAKKTSDQKQAQKKGSKKKSAPRIEQSVEPVIEVSEDSAEIIEHLKDEPVEQTVIEVQEVDQPEDAAETAEAVEAEPVMEQPREVATELTRPLRSVTRAQLYKEAQELKIPGRSTMNKEELLVAVEAAKA